MANTKELDSEINTILKNSYISKRSQDTIIDSIKKLENKNLFTKKETKEINKCIMCGKINAEKKDKIREFKEALNNIIEEELKDNGSESIKPEINVNDIEKDMDANICSYNKYKNTYPMKYVNYNKHKKNI